MKFNTKKFFISECREYGENIFENIVITDPTDGSKVSKRIDRCGHKVVPLIVGGEETKEKEFPHMALIGCKEVESQ